MSIKKITFANNLERKRGGGGRGNLFKCFFITENGTLINSNKIKLHHLRKYVLRNKGSSQSKKYSAHHFRHVLLTSRSVGHHSSLCVMIEKCGARVTVMNCNPNPNLML